MLINANRREGTARAVVEVGERLARQHDVTLVSRTAEDVDFSSLRWQRIGGPGWPEVVDFASFVALSDRWLERQSFDIIHSAGPNTTVADVYTIQTVHSVKVNVMASVESNVGASLPRRWTRHSYDRRVLSVERRCYRDAGPMRRLGFLPVSMGTQMELQDAYPIGDSLVQVVPNGADLERFSPRRRGDALSKVVERHDLSPGDFVLLFSGGDWRRKGLHHLIGSLKHLPPNVKLLIAGDHPTGDEMRSLCGSIGVADRVRFAGFRSDIENYYAAADLFVFPTAYEAFSLATIEAAASGLPVLMPDVSGAQELIGDGQCGTIILPTPDGIASAVQVYYDDAELRQRASIAARRRVEQLFSWDRIADQTLGFYRELLASRQPIDVNVGGQ